MKKMMIALVMLFALPAFADDPEFEMIEENDSWYDAEVDWPRPADENDDDVYYLDNNAEVRDRSYYNVPPVGATPFGK